MPMTISEKILAAHTQADQLVPGQLIEARLDFVFGNDITAPIAIDVFHKAGGKKVFDPQRVALIPDHFVPNKDIQSAQQAKILRDFAREHELPWYWEVGRMGIEHVLLPEQGLVLPGDLIIGADSHTCTYGALGAFATGVGSTDLGAAMVTGRAWFKVPESIKIIYKGQLRPHVGGKDLILYAIGQLGVDGARYKALEITGETIATLPMDDRFTISNMAIEAGAKVGIIPPDELTENYVKTRAKRQYRFYQADPDAEYQAVYEWDVSGMEPQVAKPHLPENTVPVTELTDVAIHQVVIGSCTNGRIGDLRVAAQILKGKKVSPEIRCIIIPGSQEVYQTALKEGLFDIFTEAEAAISTPTCGPCLGGYMGILADGEVAVSTTNRNFLGRMGHINSEVYLASPAVAAASAITGYITHPAEAAGE